MTCGQPSKINERSEGVVVCQFLSPFGMPLQADDFDEVLFTLHDSSGNIVNDRDEISVLNENGGEWTESYGVESVSLDRRNAYISTDQLNVIQDGWKVVPLLFGNGAAPPNNRPLPATSLGAITVALPRPTMDAWGPFPDSLLLVSAFTLRLNSDDTQIIAPAPGTWEYQSRYILLSVRKDGETVVNATIPLLIRNLAVVT